MTHDEQDRIERELGSLPTRDLTQDAHGRIEMAMDRAMHRPLPLRRVPAWAAVAAAIACGVIGWLARGPGASAPAAPAAAVRVAAPIDRLFPREDSPSRTDPRRWRVLEVTNEEPRTQES